MDAALARELVMDGDVSGMKQLPALVDRTECEVELLPGEEQRRIVASDGIPGGSSDGIAGAHESGAGEALGGMGAECFGISAGGIVFVAAVAVHDAEAEGRQPRLLVQQCDRAGGGAAVGEDCVVVERDHHSPMPEGRRAVTALCDPEIAPCGGQLRIGARPDHRPEPGERRLRGALVEDDQVLAEALLPEGGADRGLGLGHPVEAEDENVGVVVAVGR